MALPGNVNRFNKAFAFIIKEIIEEVILKFRRTLFDGGL
jgi:hypothetical protein